MRDPIEDARALSAKYQMRGESLTTDEIARLCDVANYLSDEHDRLSANCERLRTDNARLRGLMPRDSEIASIRNVAYLARREGARTVHTDAWLARLDAARAAKGGE